MTKKEKEIQIALGTYLQIKWKEYLDFKDKGYKLYVKGNKLYDKGYKLYVKGRKLISEGDKLYIKGRKDKLYDKGRKLCTKGYNLYIKAELSYTKAVIEVHGENVEIDWKNGSIIKKGKIK